MHISTGDSHFDEFRKGLLELDPSSTYSFEPEYDWFLDVIQDDRHVLIIRRLHSFNVRGYEGVSMVPVMESVFPKLSPDVLNVVFKFLVPNIWFAKRISQVIPDERRLLTWLNSPNKAFDGKTPASMILMGKWKPLFQMLDELQS